MVRLLVGVAFWLVINPVSARADDPPPCAAEADAVKSMKQRDAALAYPTSKVAKNHLDAGKRAFGVQQYDLAIEEYTAAGLSDEAPLILYNLGQTYRAAKDYEKAIKQYRLFLDRGRPGDELRALVECQIQTMTEELEHAASTAPPTGPAPDSDDTSEPRHEQAPVEHVTIVEAPRSMWTGTRQIAVAFGAAGLVSIGAGIVFGLQVQDLKEDAARLCPSDPCGNADEANLLIDRANTRSTYSNVALGVGAGLVVTSVVLWFVGAPSDARPTSTALVPNVSASAAGIAYTARF